MAPRPVRSDTPPALLIGCAAGFSGATQFRQRTACRVRRFLPPLHAMNFVLDEVLDDGVDATLNLDVPGKSLSFRLRDLPVELPGPLLCRLAGPPEIRVQESTA
jgi:hypothetical protein